MDFDDSAADQLIDACGQAVTTLSEQRGPRATVVGEALDEFRGPFALAFRRNAAAQVAARNRLIGALDDLAHQVRFAKTQAAEARHDLKQQQEKVLWRLLEDGFVAVSADYVRSMIPGLSHPAQLSEAEVPRPAVVIPAMVFEPHSWATSGGPGTVSAVPDALKKAASLIFSQEDAAEIAGQDVLRAIDRFVESCSWVSADVSTFAPAVSQFNQDDNDDAGQLAKMGRPSARQAKVPI